ncbi:hypothetical protein BU17DRAFT_77513 [Hysterangium stoloniferum]|nr:hypothetical protein BU17DRAFT_77513 [Hysterangium stoloniferum]
MHLLKIFFGIACLLFPTQGLSYFVINQPTKGTQWVNGQANYATWTAGLGQDITMFDVELARLSTDGLLFVALNDSPINVLNVPAADDYFLLFLNSTHGAVYSVSQRFSILSAGESSNSSTTPAGQLLASVTVSGAPNPTSSFAYTFTPTSDAITTRVPYVLLYAILGGLLSTWPMY